MSIEDSARAEDAVRESSADIAQRVMDAPQDVKDHIRDVSTNLASGQLDSDAASHRVPFAFQDNTDGTRLSLTSAVFQALGAASMCWQHVSNAGIFDSTRAKEIGETLLQFIEEVYPPATVEAFTTDDTMEIFQGQDRDWYWRRQAPNGRIVSIGGEGYTNFDDAMNAALRVNRDVPTGAIGITPGKELMDYANRIDSPEGWRPLGASPAEEGTLDRTGH